MTQYAYLTIDDAPSTDFADKLNFLDRNNIPAVWFCQGNYMQERPDMVIDAIRRGYIIGNHSYSHPSFDAISTDEGIEEIRVTDAIINHLYDCAGVPRLQRYFRFPYGNKGHGDDPEQISSAESWLKRHALQYYLRELKYTPPHFDDITNPFFNSLLSEADWYWTYDSRDWETNHPDIPGKLHTHEQVVAELDRWKPENGNNHRGAAEMILVHDFPGVAHPLFSKIITRMLEKGFQFNLPISS